MRILIRIIFAILTLVLTGKNSSVFSQILDGDHHAADSLLTQASFSMHRDNYFITGIPLNQSPSKENSDIKYQISFKQRLRRTPLPGGFYPYLLYTQKAFWNIYESSKPFNEINFNPGFAFVRPFYLKGHRLTYASLSLEHESNGRDSLFSRSWNFFAFSLNSRWNSRWTFGLRLWLPMAYKDDNPDLLRYIGHGEASASYAIKPGKWSADVLLKKGDGWNTRGALQVQLNWRPFKDENQYLMLQWYQGSAESLVDYQVRTSMIRVGFALKPSQLRIF